MKKILFFESLVNFQVLLDWNPVSDFLPWILRSVAKIANCILLVQSIVSSLYAFLKIFLISRSSSEKNQAIWWKSFGRLDICIFYLPKGTLWEEILFEKKYNLYSFSYVDKNIHGFSIKKYRYFLQKSILRVQTNKLLRDLIPKNFQNLSFRIPMKKIVDLCGTFPAVLSKLKSTSPETALFINVHSSFKLFGLWVETFVILAKIFRKVVNIAFHVSRGISWGKNSMFL